MTGVALATQPVASIEDVGGNVITSATGTITATVTTGNGTLTNATATLNNGVATFSGLAVTDVADSDVLTFSDSPYTSATATIAVTVAARPVVILPPVAVATAPVVTPTSGFQENNVSVVADYAPVTSTTSYTATSATTATQGVHVTLGNVMTIALANGYSVVLIKNAGVAPALLASDLLANSYVTVRTTTGMKLQTLVASSAGSLSGKLLFASLPLGITNLVVQGANQQGQEFELTTNVYIASQSTVVSSNIAPHAATLPTSTLASVTQLVKSALAQTLLQVTVASYTSNVGKPANNLAVSQQQATAEEGFIGAGLSSQGITNVNFVATGMGATSPIASNATAAGRAKNGRVTVTVIEA
jgi:outer membrane protein OmpA-like peptidoglycan-associated protein